MNEVQGQGPVSATPDTGSNAATTSTGQQNASASTPASGSTPTTGEDSFFDVSGLNPELMPVYKRMQGDYTRKTQDLARQRKDLESAKDKASQYDAFMRDPVSNIRRLASQYKIDMTAANGEKDQLRDWQPQTWGEVLEKATARAKEEAKQEVLSEIQPLLTGYQQLRKENIESHLNKIAPDWKEYEADMAALLQEHPTLANDPAKLYRLAVPSERAESAAYTRALEHLQRKVDSSQLAGASTTGKKTGVNPPAMRTVREAAEWAQQTLASQGIRMPA